MKKILRRTALILLALVVVIQFIPYGRDHSNPPGRVEPAWDSPETHTLAKRACYDCHSNETVWPWYSHVAPVSWLVQNDVDHAREEMNFSEWDRPQDEAKHAADMVRKRKMPLSYYLPMHPAARLTDAERAALAEGLAATLGDEHHAHGGEVGGAEEAGEEADD